MYNPLSFNMGDHMMDPMALVHPLSPFSPLGPLYNVYGKYMPQSAFHPMSYLTQQEESRKVSDVHRNDNSWTK